MKRIKNISRFTAAMLVLSAAASPAFAQRQDGNGGRSGNSSHTFTPGRPGGGFEARPQNTVRQAPTASAPQQQRTPSPLLQQHLPQNNRQFPSNQPTVRTAPQNDYHSQTAPRTDYNSNRGGYSSRPGYTQRPGNPGYSNRGSYGGYNNDYRGGYHGYDRPGNVNRFYYSGAYHPHPYYYRPFRPYWGIHINILPAGYYSFYYGPRRYYYYDGLFYEPYGGYYQTIVPPLGAYIPMLPAGAYPIVINGGDYYEFNGTYYQRVYGAPNNYEIVGVNGLLKSDLPAGSDGSDIISDESLPGAVSSVAPVGMNELPQNYKTVVLNDVTYYVSPSGEYYTKNIGDDGRVSYQLATREAPAH